MVSELNVGFKYLLHQGLSEPDFNGDLVYKLKKIMGSQEFGVALIFLICFEKVVIRHRRIGDYLNVM